MHPLDRALSNESAFREYITSQTRRQFFASSRRRRHEPGDVAWDVPIAFCHVKGTAKDSVMLLNGARG